MAFVSSLRYYRDETYNAKDTFTKAGAFIYGGSATEFHEWEFRTLIKWDGTKEDEKPLLAARIVEGLRAEAFLVAKDMGPRGTEEADWYDEPLGFFEQIEGDWSADQGRLRNEQLLVPH